MIDGIFPRAISAHAGMRATTGQAISIRYDAEANALVFVEDDWFADPIRSGSVPPRALVRKRLGAETVTRLKLRRRALPHAS